MKAWSGEAGQIVQVVVEDETALVSEAWTGPQVEWRIARGREGSFGGRTLLDPAVWGTFCLLFFLGLADFRKPLSLRNLDLLVLLGFSVSLVYFIRGDIFTSVPLVYPVLAYLLIRGLWVGMRRRESPLNPIWPTWAFVAAAMFLLAFRVGLSLESPRAVVDVGLASVVGADRILEGEAPWGNMPRPSSDLQACGPPDAEGTIRERIQTNGRCEYALDHADAYGPVTYLAYVPAVHVFGWSGEWDSLAAAHATSLAADTLAIVGLVLLGLRFGGFRLAAMLAFAWTAYPFTSYTLNASTNDTIMSAFLILGLWLASSTWARGSAVALAGWAKFGALLLAPLWASYPTLTRRRLIQFGVAFSVTTLAAFAVLLLEPSLVDAVRMFWARTVAYHSGRDSPFSLWGWGQYHAEGIPDLGFMAPVLATLAVALALLVAVVPRRKGPVELAALTAAVLVAFQLALTNWSYLYIAWLFPFVALWLLLPGEPGRAGSIDLDLRERDTRSSVDELAGRSTPTMRTGA